MKSYTYISAGNESKFLKIFLISATIISIKRDGIGYSPITVSDDYFSIPTGKEVKIFFGEISFASNMEAGEEVRILYQSTPTVIVLP